MKKSNFLKTVLGVAGAMLISSGVFGQNPAAPYALYDADKVNPTTVDYVTVGKTMGYYALPDPVYHPNYVSAGTLTAGFTWGWANTVNPGTAATITPGVGPLANYATILFPVVGAYTFTVNENSPAAFGGCAGSTTTFKSMAVAAPTAQFTTADVLTGLCGAQAASPLSIAITENVPDALAAYAFAVTESVDNIDNLGAVTANVSSNLTFVNFGLGAGAKVKSGTAGFVAATPNFTYGFNSSALAVQNSKRTQYTYTLVSAAGVTGSGIVSAISQKSDYLGAPVVNGYAFGAKTTVVFIVNPTPVTGPIYYVPNNFAY
jgi:hypothetical protein